MHSFSCDRTSLPLHTRLFTHASSHAPFHTRLFTRDSSHALLHTRFFTHAVGPQHHVPQHHVPQHHVLAQHTRVSRGCVCLSMCDAGDVWCPQARAVVRMPSTRKGCAAA
eukprot:717632-Rhodomonas_salina.1